jgi:CopG family transcriptional regulator, nickel-responsive regulator
MKTKVTRFGVSIENDLLEKFDKLSSKKGYRSRSEALRDLIRDKLVSEKIDDVNALCFGIITFVYDHHKREIEKTLNSFQHDYFKSILFTTHVHINHDNCMEMVIVKDKAGKVKMIAEQILSFKGVKHGKYVITSTAKTF